MSIAMMANKGSTKIVNSMIPGAEVLLGHDHLNLIVFVCLFVSLFVVKGFSSHSRIFYSYGDVTITCEGLLILTYTQLLWLFSNEVL